jgi:hypothetical protein
LSDFLHHIVSLVTPDAAGHVHHGVDVAGVTLHAHAVGPLLADSALLLGLAALVWLLCRPVVRNPLFVRWAAGGLVAALLLAAPLLAIHATHHADGDSQGRCAVAGIAHSVAGGLVTTPPTLAPFTSGAIALPPYLHVDAERLPLAPIARGPPATLTA